jgi:hypothetical protein
LIIVLIVRVEMAHFRDLGRLEPLKEWIDTVMERSRTALQFATNSSGFTDSELFAGIAGTQGNSASFSTSTDPLELHLDLCFVALLFGRLWQTHNKVWPGISVLATVVICQTSALWDCVT